VVFFCFRCNIVMISATTMICGPVTVVLYNRWQVFADMFLFCHFDIVRHLFTVRNCLCVCVCACYDCFQDCLSFISSL